MQWETVGQACTHSELQNAICTNDPRNGTWICSAPKTEEQVFAVCEGKKKGTPCSYTAKVDPRFDHSMDVGLNGGVCGRVHETHTAMLCLATADDARIGAPTAGVPDMEEDVGSRNLIIAVVATAAASLFVGGVAGVGGHIIMQRCVRQKEPTTVCPPEGDGHPEFSKHV